VCCVGVVVVGVGVGVGVGVHGGSSGWVGAVGGWKHLHAPARVCGRIALVYMLLQTEPSEVFTFSRSNLRWTPGRIRVFVYIYTVHELIGVRWRSPPERRFRRAKSCRSLAATESF
jgi:hypothetical protein